MDENCGSSTNSLSSAYGLFLPKNNYRHQSEELELQQHQSKPPRLIMVKSIKQVFYSQQTKRPTSQLTKSKAWCPPIPVIDEEITKKESKILNWPLTKTEVVVMVMATMKVMTVSVETVAAKTTLGVVVQKLTAKLSLAKQKLAK